MEHDSQPATKGDLAELAASTQREFTSLRADMATKSDLNAVNQSIGRVLQAIADHEMNSSARASMWREDFDALKARVAKIEDHLHL